MEEIDYEKITADSLLQISTNALKQEKARQKKQQGEGWLNFLEMCYNAASEGKTKVEIEKGSQNTYYYHPIREFISKCEAIGMEVKTLQYNPRGQNSFSDNKVYGHAFSWEDKEERIGND